VAKRSDKEVGSGTKGRSGEGAPKRKSAGAAGAKADKPRIRVTHSEAPSTGPTASKRPRRAAAGGRTAGAEEIERRSARARATVRSLGGAARPAQKRLAPAAPKGREPLPEPKGPGPRKRSVVPPSPSDEARRRAIAIAAAGLDKKAIGVEVLDVTGRVDYADYLVIMTGTSDRHVHAIAMGIEEGLKRLKVSPLSVEGLQTASWVLMDFDDVVVHVFQEDTRRLYDIEGLWMDASRVTVDGAGPELQPLS
jgi:ribosome-associated protein